MRDPRHAVQPNAATRGIQLDPVVHMGRGIGLGQRHGRAGNGVQPQLVAQGRGPQALALAELRGQQARQTCDHR